MRVEMGCPSKREMSDAANVGGVEGDLLRYHLLLRILHNDREAALPPESEPARGEEESARADLGDSDTSEEEAPPPCAHQAVPACVMEPFIDTMERIRVSHLTPGALVPRADHFTEILPEIAASLLMRLPKGPAVDTLKMTRRLINFVADVCSAFLLDGLPTDWTFLCRGQRESQFAAVASARCFVFVSHAVANRFARCNVEGGPTEHCWTDEEVEEVTHSTIVFGALLKAAGDDEELVTGIKCHQTIFFTDTAFDVKHYNHLVDPDTMCTGQARAFLGKHGWPLYVKDHSCMHERYQ